ncbi:MAG: thioredoxin domain-containing protein [Wolbachia endosymbiont of Tyrophagus putrescentiae]|nr:thioredoxin domain-containing protein [Wolbachia endosymbiont of Tyrophagus putrescentiae]
MFLRILLLLVFFSMSSYAQTQVKEVTTQELLSLLPDDKFLGDVNAPVIVIEYAALTCYYCSLFHKNILPQIKSEYIDKGKVLYVFRHFPLDYRALKSAMLGRCYTRQEDYFNFIRAVFDSIDAWNYSNASDLSLLQKIAALSNLKKDTFDRCIDDKVAMDKIVNDKFLAINKLGVEASPVFFIKLNKSKSNVEPSECKHEGYRKFDYFADVIDALCKQAAVK